MPTNIFLLSALRALGTNSNSDLIDIKENTSASDSHSHKKRKLLKSALPPSSIGEIYPKGT